MHNDGKLLSKLAVYFYLVKIETIPSPFGHRNKRRVFESCICARARCEVVCWISGGAKEVTNDRDDNSAEGHKRQRTTSAQAAGVQVPSLLGPTSTSPRVLLVLA
jgi:hypothetical protein